MADSGSEYYTSDSGEETDSSAPEDLYDQDVDVNAKYDKPAQKQKSVRHRIATTSSSTSSTPSRVPKPISKVRKKIESHHNGVDLAKPSVTDLSEFTTALGDITNALKRVVKRLDKQDSQLKSLEQKIVTSTTCSSSTSSGESKSRDKVSSVVRVSLGVFLLCFVCTCGCIGVNEIHHFTIM